MLQPQNIIGELYMLYIIITALLIVADQVTKYITVANLELYEGVIVIEGILNFSRFHNTGGPWSLFDNHSYIFIIATFIILIAELLIFKKYPLKSNLSKTSASLINAGAIGNLIDRIFRGYVVDMIELKFIEYPIFNLADCCIVVGCILMCIYTVFFQNDKKM